MKEKIKSVIGKTFGLEVTGIPDDAGLGTLSKWDSLGHLELMMALEMEFGVQIPTESMLELTSIEGIEDYLKTSL